ncbi:MULTISPECIES: YicC/YloC family endoribonuclease [Bacillus]|uniref:YicC/YloC family endoribonuclease n=1 Tax=Bacillus TaxID=1386 RepID=UPI000BB6DC6E|nr:MULTISPECIES: YicC/YloC family endoribonuclease [Bacillus]
MVKSMTGYGRAVHRKDEYFVSVEMKSVNSRFCEVSLKMPKQLLSMEEKIKKVIYNDVHRGRLEVYITLEGQHITGKDLEVDWDLLDKYFQTLHNVQSKYGLNNSIEISDLLQIEGVFQAKEVEKMDEQIEKQLLDMVHKATYELVSMREQEGLQLSRDIMAQLNEMENCLIEIKNQAPIVIQSYRERLEKKLKDFLGDDYTIEEQRLLTEVAIITDKADINEEVTRINSHVQQVKETLNAEGPVGRKLDFLVQELNREINTIGSKGNDAIISSKVVEMKALLEKMKEQVQNIE